METLTKVVIPITTFILGMFVTLLLKRYELRRANFRQHVEKSSRLVMDWYNHILTLTLKLKDGTTHDDLAMVLSNYEQRREFLPQLQQSITVLRRYRAGRHLVEELERFRKMVTDCPDEHVDSLLPMISRYLPHRDYLRWECRVPFFIDLHERITWNISLKELDGRVQDIQYEAGKLLS